MRHICFLLLCLFIVAVYWSPVQVSAAPLVGIHILEPSELDNADQALKDLDSKYVTIPIRTDDLDHKKWRQFFETAEQKNIIPIVRLATEYDTESDAWKIPTRQDIVRFAHFFSAMPWNGDKRYVIIFNEPNHSNEWGGTINAAGYADVLSFSSSWLKTEPFDYVVLPAGLDAAAPSGAKTMESFEYIDEMVEAEPDILSKIDMWNSHAYPNPGFSSSAYKSAKNAIDGWEYELNYLSSKHETDLDVMITETGWDQRNFSQYQLTQYYEHALETVWNDSRIKGITPFILNGNNGIFNHFSFLLPDGSPSPQMKALIAAKGRISDKL